MLVSQFNGDARRYQLKYHHLPIKATIKYKKQHQTLLRLSKNENNKSRIYHEDKVKVINFNNETVVQCDVSVVKNTSEVDMQIVTK